MSSLNNRYPPPIFLLYHFLSLTIGLIVDRSDLTAKIHSYKGANILQFFNPFQTMLRIFKLISPALPKMFHFLYPADRPDVHWRKLMSINNPKLPPIRGVQCDFISSLKNWLIIGFVINDLHWIQLLRVVFDI